VANPLKIPGTITTIKTLDQGVYALTIASEKRVPRFKAGQFLHLTLDDYDPQGGFWPESRVFSIASAPSSQDIEIVYSVKGRYTTRMSREIVLGKRVWLKFPYGEFSIETAAAPGQAIVLVAGGTGISPFISYLRGIHINGPAEKRQIHLIYGIRKPEHLLYPEVLYACCSEAQKVTIDLFIENGTDQVLQGANRCKGMITLNHILDQGKRMAQPAYFLSGPPAMIQTFKKGLTSAGIEGTNIKIDEWE
jgi:predicted ferric reductase